MATKHQSSSSSSMDIFPEKRRKSSEWDMQASLEAEPPNSRASLLEAEAKRLENAHGMSNKRLKDFTLDVYDGSLFQSLTSIMTTSKLSSMPINKLIASIASSIETQLTDLSHQWWLNVPAASKSSIHVFLFKLFQGSRLHCHYRAVRAASTNCCKEICDYDCNRLTKQFH